MATDLAMNDSLIKSARTLGGQKTKKTVVTQALQDYIQKRQKFKLTELFGQIDCADVYDFDYDFDRTGQWRRGGLQSDFFKKPRSGTDCGSLFLCTPGNFIKANRYELKSYQHP
jgi:hypothetical protein